jgi:glutathione S-transferase
MKLYWHPLSGHAHRAQLFLSLIGVKFDLVEVDLARGAHKAADFLKLNSVGQVPGLDDDGVIVCDSNAIMVYVAKKFGKTDWLPEDAKGAAAVERWLSVSAGQIAFGPAAARLITVFNAPYNAEEVIKRAHLILALIEAELAGRNWIAGSTRPTVADVALYSYIARAPEGNVDLSQYPAVLGWLNRVEGLPGFTPFKITPVGLQKVA